MTLLSKAPKLRLRKGIRQATTSGMMVEPCRTYTKECWKATTSGIKAALGVVTRIGMMVEPCENLRLPPTCHFV